MFAGIVGLAILIGVLFSLRSAFEFVEADQICIIQDPVDGELHLYVEPGLYWQNFGTVTKYEKEFQYWFSAAGDEGSGEDESIKCRFNDGGHASISGSVRIKMPMTYDMMTKLHKLFGSQTAVESQLIRPLIEKSVYMTGPIMSSKESYADKRNDLLYYIEDQITYGVYKTRSKDIKEPDAITGELKTVKVVEIVQDTAGKPFRNERSPLAIYNIQVYNLSINDVKYDAAVEKQIQEQQRLAMDVQTAIADAKKAEQNAIKIAKQGEANAAEAKWKQEVVKAQAITEAEQKAQVASWAMKEAEYYKQTQILKAQADAEYKRAVMYADGGLTQKLQTYERVMFKYAEAMKDYKGNWVPTYMIGAGSSGYNYNGAEMLFQAMGVKTLKDLSLDMSVPGNTGKK